MKKKLAVLGMCLILASALFGQSPSQERMAQYQQLQEQREQLLSWSLHHPFSTYFEKEKKAEEAQQLRQKMYQEFRDIEIWNLRKSQQDIKMVNGILGGDLPFVPGNALPADNLNTLAEQQPQLFKELLLAYPENMARVETGVLLDLLAQDETFTKYFHDYLTYLQNFRRYPNCVENMRAYFKKQIEYAQSKDWKEGIMSFLASGCQEYAQAQQSKLLTQKAIERFLQEARINPHIVYEDLRFSIEP